VRWHGVRVAAPSGKLQACASSARRMVYGNGHSATNGARTPGLREDDARWRT
jgi:hypothetical protein